MRKILLALLLLLLPSVAQAQFNLSTTVCPGLGCVIIPTGGNGTIGIQVAGTFSGTLAFTSSIDGITYSALSMTPTVGGSAVTTTTTIGNWTTTIAGQGYVKVAFTAYTSGTVVVTYSLSPTTIGSLVGVPTGVAAGQVLVSNGVGVAPVYSPSLNQVRFANQFTGADAGAQITAAIADLPAGGGTVDARGLLGAQTISTTITIGKPVQLLLGSATYTYTGGGTNIIALNTAGSSVVGISPTATILTTAGTANGIQPLTNTIVANLTLRGPNSSQSPSQGINSGSADNVRIENTTIEQWGNHGINTGASSTRWFIANNLVQNNIQDGILLSGLSDQAVVTGNVVRNNGSNGIDTNSSNGTISNNIVDSNGSGHSGTDCWGILIGAVSGYSANYNTVTGNTVKNSTCQNIIVKPATGQTVNFNTVSGNTVLGGTAANNDGITLDGSSAGTVHGNIVTGNTIKTLVRHGIFVDGSVATVTNNAVTGNMVESAGGNGIYLGTGATDTIVTGNSTTGNTGTALLDSGTTNAIGINRTALGSGGLSTAGTLTTNLLVSQTDVLVASGNNLYWTTRTLLNSPADGKLNLTNLAATVGLGFDATADSVLRLRNRAQSADAALIASTLQNKTVYSAAGIPLPTCNGAAEGTLASVSDATVPTFNSTYASGGAVHAQVHCDGTNWKH